MNRRDATFVLELAQQRRLRSSIEPDARGRGWVVVGPTFTITDLRSADYFLTRSALQKVPARRRRSDRAARRRKAA